MSQEKVLDTEKERVANVKLAGDDREESGVLQSPRSWILNYQGG